MFNQIAMEIAGKYYCACCQKDLTVKGGDLSNRYGGIMQRSSRVGMGFIQKMEKV